MSESTLSKPVVMVKLDRRRDRLTLPPCPECAREEPRVLMRTDWVLYLRCSACRTVWSESKP
jgi:hypothetical protein